MDVETLKAEGWQHTNEGRGFTGFVGPYWWKRDADGSRRMGLFVEERHCNDHMGTLHGGVIATFADIALGMGVAGIVGEKRFNCVTTTLQTQFIAIAHRGDFITCCPEVVHAGRQMVFVRGLIKVGEKTIASVEGVWKVLEPRPAKPAS